MDSFGPLKLYFMIVPVLLSMNIIVASILYFKYKDKHYFWHLAFWAGFFVHILIQGSLQDRIHPVSLGLFAAGAYVSAFTFSRYIESLVSVRINIAASYLILPTGLISSFGLHLGGVTLNIAILPALIGGISPTLISVPILWRERKKLTLTQAGISLIIFLMALHTLDYSYAVDRPDLMFPGYLVMLTLLVGMTSFSFGAVFEKVLLDFQLKEVLYQQSRMATLGAFSMEIAHEIRNPLAVILGAAKVIQVRSKANRLSPEEAFGKADMILNMSNRLTSIIRNLSGGVGIGGVDPLEKVNISQVIEDALLILKVRAMKEKVRIDIVKPPQNLFVAGRPIQLSQIVMNLLHNSLDALEAREQHAKWIEIRVLSTSEGVQINFTDGGPGIPKEIHEKLFQNLFTTKPVGKGTGLGLGISRRIAEEHGGSLVYNELGSNTQFILNLKNWEELKKAVDPAA